MQEIEESLKFAAFEDVAQAEKVLYDRIAFPDTPRAKAIADLHMWKAERYNKDLFGTKQIKLDATVNNAVSYEFNINVNNKAATPQGAAAIEGVFSRIEEALPAPAEEELQEIQQAAYVDQELTVLDVPEAARPSLDFSKD